MKKVLDHDPLTHTTQYHHYNNLTGETTIETVQDVEPYLELAKTLRNDESYSKKGIKESFWHYATIPNSVIEQIRQKHGLNVFEPNDSKAVFKVLNSEYPALKVTSGHHD